MFSSGGIGKQKQRGRDEGGGGTIAGWFRGAESYKVGGSTLQRRGNITRELRTGVECEWGGLRNLKLQEITEENVNEYEKKCFAMWTERDKVRTNDERKKG